MSPVNSRQAERSRQTRRRVLEAANELFIERGYGNAALQDIADRADVAVQTIYFTFRNKRNLLKELVDVTVAGDDAPVATMERPWFTEAMNTPGAEEHLRAHVAGVAAILGRVSATVEVLRTAIAMEPELRAAWEEGLSQRYTVQHAAARAMVAKPGARPDVTADQAADALFAILSPELYLLLVRGRSWTPERWAEWAFTTLRPQLVR
ncbi:MAG: TetR/AcrR family transcriptional regulator [Streptomyces sp.]|nr:TetR/AcrR family transcriptional regulator [Streptomyces sp.]